MIITDRVVAVIATFSHHRFDITVAAITVIVDTGTVIVVVIVVAAMSSSSTLWPCGHSGRGRCGRCCGRRSHCFCCHVVVDAVVAVVIILLQLQLSCCRLTVVIVKVEVASWSLCCYLQGRHGHCSCHAPACAGSSCTGGGWGQGGMRLRGHQD
jgi:hypothetical protein